MRDDDYKEIARIFFGFSDPTRLRVLMEVAHEEKCVGNVAKALNLSVQNVSHHLRYLESLGIVEFRRYGRFVRYRANKEKISGICSFFIELLEGGKNTSMMSMTDT